MKKKAIKVLALGHGPELEASLRRGDQIVVFRKDQIGKYDFSKDDIVLCVFPDGGRMAAWVIEQPLKLRYGSVARWRSEKAEENFKKMFGNLRPEDVIVVIKLQAVKADPGAGRK